MIVISYTAFDDHFRDRMSLAQNARLANEPHESYPDSSLRPDRAAASATAPLMRGQDLKTLAARLQAAAGGQVARQGVRVARALALPFLNKPGQGTKFKISKGKTKGKKLGDIAAWDEL